MSARIIAKGQPLVMLAILMSGWVGVRLVIWDAAATPHTADRAAGLAQTAQLAVPGRADRDLAARRGSTRGADDSTSGAVGGGTDGGTDGALAWLESPAPLPSWHDPYASIFGPDGAPAAPPVPLAPAASNTSVPARTVIGHNLLMLAGLSQMEMPDILAAYLRGAGLAAPVPAGRTVAAAAANPAAPASRPSRPSRWTGDGWLLLRDDVRGSLLTGRPGYGRSQMGAVVRYRLAPMGGRAPQAFVRAGAALQGEREKEVGAGFSARPLAAVPVRLAAELRLSETDRGTRARPIAYAVTELPPMALPLGAAAEVYVQGGYAGGDNATAFVDGQLRVARPVLTISDQADAHLNAGGGVWGGAQQGAARLDIGPSAALTFRLGETRSRVAVDYRFRVAGDALPASGPSLTLATGF